MLLGINYVLFKSAKSEILSVIYFDWLFTKTFQIQLLGTNKAVHLVKIGKTLSKAPVKGHRWKARAARVKSEGKGGTQE